MAITQVSNSLVKQDLTISGGTVDNTVIGSGTPAAGTFTTVAGTLASTVTGTTAAASDNSTKIATTAYVTTAIANLVDTAPSALNTLNELAAALGDDANFSTTVTNSIATKLPLAGGTMTGDIAHASNFTLDVGGNIKLDADDAGEVRYLDGGTHYATIKKDGNNALFQSIVADGDFLIQGIDGSSFITAASFDMSEGGNATFAGTGTFAGGSANNNDDANILTLNASEHARLLVDTSSTSGHRATLALESNGNELTLGTTGSASFLTSAGDLAIDGGNVGIGLTSNISSKLHVNTEMSMGPDGNNRGIINYSSDKLSFGTRQSSSNYFSTVNITNGKVIIGGSTTQGGGLLTLEGADAAMLTLHRTADTGDQEILFYDHGDHNATIIGKNSGHLQFRTNGRSTTTLHLTPGGNVGIRTDNPKGLLHVQEANSGMNTANGNFDKLVLEDSSHSGMTILGGANTHGAIYFGDPDVNDVGQIKYKHNDNSLCLTTNSVERWKIDSGGSIRQGGSINFMNSSLTLSKFWVAKSRDILGTSTDHAVYYTESGIHHQFWVGGARRVNIMNTGITFGTDIAQANTLDDYEEGTFQTQLTCSSGSITLNGSYDDLAYTKIGNVVTVTGYLSVSSVASPSGILFIGLPFSSASGHKHSASASVSFNVVNAGEALDAWPIIDQNSNTIQIYVGAGGSVSASFAQRMQTSSDIRVQATYFVA